MKTFKELESQWNQCKGKGQILVDAKHPLRMFLNINNKGNKELLIPVPRFNTTFKSTVAIGMNNYHSPEGKFLAIELIRSDLESEYMSMCFDLIESSRSYGTATESRKQLFNSLKKWYYLFSEINSGLLPDNEIRGLMGELNYIISELKAGREDTIIINAWQIFKNSSRDFIFDDTWSEIKTNESTKDYVTVSSIEQLDHETEGQLVVYQIEKRDFNDPESISLNDLVKQIQNDIGFEAETIFNQKLLSKGYTYNEEYDNYRFAFVGTIIYLVADDFPRLMRKNLPLAIWRSTYDLKLDLIERWKKNE